MDKLFKPDKKGRIEGFFQRVKKNKFVFSFEGKKCKIFLFSLFVILISGFVVASFYYWFKIKEGSKASVTLEEAISYLEKGGKVKAVTILEELHKKDPEDKRISYYLSLGYFGKGDYDNFFALTEKENLELLPILNLKAQYFRMQGDFKKAIEYYEKAISHYPKNINSYINLASLYQSRGDFKKAIKTLERGLKIAPRSASLNAATASVFLKIGDKEKALHYAKTALRYDKTNRQAKSILENL